MKIKSRTFYTIYIYLFSCLSFTYMKKIKYILYLYYIIFYIIIYTCERKSNKNYIYSWIS